MYAYHKSTLLKIWTERDLREEDYVYVDKTRYIAELIRNKSR